jgi:hypothetical protein
VARPASSDSRVGQLLTAFAALLVVVLIGALPALLVWATGNPLTGIAGWFSEAAADPGAAAGSAWQSLSGPDDGELFLQTLTAVGWVSLLFATWAWITFIGAFLVELGAQLSARRHGRVPRNTRPIRGMRMQQRAAAVLVAAIIGALGLPALASASVSMPTTAAAAATQQQEAPTAEQTARYEAASQTENYLMVPVERGDSLLGIAERHGLSPERLADANYGRMQPDGRSMQPGTMRIYAGWTLRVPVKTVAAANAAVAAKPAVANAAVANAAVAAKPAAADAAVAAKPAVADAAVAAKPAAANANSGAVAKPAAAERLVYVVARGDRLSDIADRFLGDADRYPEIARSNPGLERKDARFPDHIERNWQITLPSGAEDRGPRDHATGSVKQARTEKAAPAEKAAPSEKAAPAEKPAPVEKAETPTKAETPKPETPTKPEAAAPSTNAPSGAPVTNAPAAGTPASALPTTGSPAASAPAASPSPKSSAPATSAPATSAPATSAPAASPSLKTSAAPASPASSPAVPLPGVSSQPAPAPTAAADEAAAPADADDDLSATVVAGSLAGAGLLSALLLAGVMRRRHRQRQHRRPGRRLPHPRGGATETALRVAEQPADVDRLDRALRHLTATLSDRDEPLPDIAATWIVDQEVTLVLSEPCPDAPAPWIADGSQWTLPGHVVLPAAEDVLAPLPTLVTVGSQPGRHLLIDLERLGGLSIGGDPDRAAALLRYLACELACNTWSDEVEIVLAGFPARETELLVALNPDRVRAVTSVPEATERLRRRATSVAAALASAGAADTLAGRVTDLGEAWAPQVLLVAGPGPDDVTALERLGGELADAGRCAVAFAATSAPAGDPHLLTVDAEGALRVRLSTPDREPFLDVEGSAAGLPVAELEPLAEIMAQTRSATDEPAPPAAEPEPWAQDTDAAGAVLRLFHSEPRAEAPPATDASIVAMPNLITLSPVPELSPASALPPAPEPPPVPREVTAAVRQRSKRSDPDLDEDLRAWLRDDTGRPRISVLGPVEVESPGPAPDQRRRFHAEIIVYLAQRGARGATGDQLSEALWPDQNVKDASRRVAITRARRWLGENPDGEPWLPEMGSDRLYRLRPGYLLDWHLFRRLRSRGEVHGPAGVKDLRAALELVRGVPLDGADRAYSAGARNPFTWLAESEIYPGHLTSAVVDTAHQLAELYLDAGDTAGVRWAVQRAWLADPMRGDDAPWIDLMRSLHLDRRTAELRNLFGELLQAREAEVPEELTPDTYNWLRQLMPDLLAASPAN